MTDLRTEDESSTRAEAEGRRKNVGQEASRRSPESGPVVRGVVLAGIAICVGFVAARLIQKSPSRLEGTAVQPIPPTASPCSEPATPLTVGPSEIRLRVYSGPGVQRREVDAQLASLAAFYSPYNIRFLLSSVVAVSGPRELMVGDRGSIDSALREAGIDPERPALGKSSDKARSIVCKVALAPLRKRLAVQHGGRENVHVMLWRKLAPSHAQLARLLPDLRGLTLLPRGGDTLLRRCLSAQSKFMPTIVLGLDAISARKPGRVDVTLAHELGHVFGLVHTRTKNDLMATEPPTCWPLLAPEQRKRVGRYLADLRGG